MYSDRVPVYHPFNPRRRSTEPAAGFVLFLFGLLFMFFVSVISSKAQPYDDGVTVTGTVKHVGTEQVTERVSTRRANGRNSYRTVTRTKCTPTVEYVVDGQTYTTKSSFQSANFCEFSVGDTIDVSHNENNPDAGKPLLSESDMKIVSFMKYVGAFITFIGAVQFVTRLIKKRKRSNDNTLVPPESSQEVTKSNW